MGYMRSKQKNKRRLFIQAVGDNFFGIVTTTIWKWEKLLTFYVNGPIPFFGMNQQTALDKVYKLKTRILRKIRLFINIQLFKLP